MLPPPLLARVKLVHKLAAAQVPARARECQAATAAVLAAPAAAAALLKPSWLRAAM